MHAIGSTLVAEGLGWLLAHPRSIERALGHNYAFDELVGGARQLKFEREVDDFSSSPEFDPAIHDGQVLLQGHRSYNERWIDTVVEPDTFSSDNGNAALSGIEETDWLIRLEGLNGPLNAWGRDFDDLRRAFEGRTPADAGALSEFLTAWNGYPPRPPRFAAFASEVAEDLRADNWADRLRSRLGLSRYSAPAGLPIRVALMSYRVADVAAAVRRRPDVAHAFCQPTVLDQRPYEYFFSAPADLGGRCMPLTRARPDRPLVFELLHPRIDYRADHILKIGEIKTPIPDWSLRDLRNDHLRRVRNVSGRADFGEFMGSDVHD